MVSSLKPESASRRYIICANETGSEVHSSKPFVCEDLWDLIRQGVALIGREAVLMLVQTVHDHAKISCLSGEITKAGLPKIAADPCFPQLARGREKGQAQS